MSTTRFDTCPRVKKYTDNGGELHMKDISLCVIGQGDLFARTLKILLPDITSQESTRNEANTVLSVSYVYSSQNEYCYLRIMPTGIEIHCRDNAGARNAAAILAQLARPHPNGGYTLPCGVVEDWPDAQYRAMMLESSGRGWLSMTELRTYIRQMALCRMNVMQFHFMENCGCNIQLDCLPDLPGFGKENRKYTKDEVRDMIAFAAELGIAITPFVEVLSHATDFAIYAGIACPGDKKPNMFTVCLGQEKTFQVIEMLLTEIAELFPDDVLHVGADEYDMSAVSPLAPYWDKCPHCQKLAAQKGFTTLREMFMYGISRLNRIVNGLGKVMMLWNADLRPGYLPRDMDRNMVIHFYRDNNCLCREKIYNLTVDGYVEDGFSVINSYYPQTYLDLEDYVSSDKLRGWSYVNDPLVRQKNRAKVPGGCCCVWDHHDHYVRTVPAGILLYADRFWNAFGDPADYDDAYGCTMTRLLFDNRLPEGTNVFACIGDVLPPLNDKELVHGPKITADLNTITQTREALLTLKNDGDELAGYYAEALVMAIEEKNKIPSTTPLTEWIVFKG